jgi:hypothetical protein
MLIPRENILFVFCGDLKLGINLRINYYNGIL